MQMLIRSTQILLFSYSTRMLDILQLFLRKEAYSFSRIDGSVPIQKRQTIVDDFNKNPNKTVALASLCLCMRVLTAL